MITFDAQTSRGISAVAIGRGAVELVGHYVGRRRVVLLIDRRVAAIHGAAIRAAVEPAAGEVLLPRGERAKTWSATRRVFSELARLGVRRDDVIVAAGGGAALDAGGLVASLWMRGLDWISVPTTLVGQSDACLGGKTALDLSEGKNLVGTFHPPVAALIDPRWLETVPRRDHRAGCFELLKCAWLGELRLLRILEHGNLAGADASACASAVERALRLKASLVASDLEDRGVRRLLNLGHTFGHALETAANFRGLRHGEAVGVGLLAAAAAARHFDLLSESWLSTKCEQVLSLSPPAISKSEVDQACAAALSDKKARAVDRRTLTLVLPRARSAIVREGVDISIFRRALERASDWTLGGS